MKQYLLSVQIDYDNPRLPESRMPEMIETVGQINDEIKKAGAWVFGGGLLAPDTATTVQLDGTMTDGPYAETKETIGGFWVLQCEDLDEALAWARRCQAACEEPIEVRPFDNLD
jgi:hypothetical protein